MNSKYPQEYLQGKVFLIGLNFIDQSGLFIERYQTYGTVLELSGNGLLKISRDDDSIFQIPYEKTTIKKAKRGEYREKSTEQIIKNPDYIMIWDVTVADISNLEEIKKHGFIEHDSKNN